jgi:ribosome biogenesis GTPase
LVLNKIDLANNSIIPWINLYEDTGYKVIKTSALTNEGIDDLKKLLTGSKNLFFGKSGVGKSSLLNKMYPGLDLKIGKISSFTDRGTHTTVTSTMLKVDDKTFIIDTPGIREFDPFGIKKEDLGYYFIEFLNFKENCRFTTCTHSHEPGCAVITAVRDRLIKAERYDSYLRILNTIEEDIVF